MNRRSALAGLLATPALAATPLSTEPLATGPWIFVSNALTHQPCYLEGEFHESDGTRSAVWTCNEQEAIGFPTAHDAWDWICTRLSPDSVILMQRGDSSMLARRESWHTPQRVQERERAREYEINQTIARALKRAAQRNS